MKPENTFIKGIHKLLHPDIYSEKTFNPMRGGTPDCFYMGFAGELWIEYKWVKKFPKTKIIPNLSPLQKAWLMRAWDRGRRPWVVVGSPDGCIALQTPAEWQGILRGEAQVLTKYNLVMRIENRCGLQGSPG